MRRVSPILSSSKSLGGNLEFARSSQSARPSASSQTPGEDVPSPFFDRHAAGLQLARALRAPPHPFVLGIARGGVVVAAAVSQALQAPLDVIVKIGRASCRERV